MHCLLTPINERRVIGSYKKVEGLNNDDGKENEIYERDTESKNVGAGEDPPVQSGGTD